MAGRRYVAATIAAVAVVGLAACGTHRPASVVPTPETSASPSATATLTPTPTVSPSASPKPTLPATLAGRVRDRIPTSERVVALTFDAGGNADGLPSILATLAREHVPATFFLTGNWVRGYPDLARRLAEGGYAVGNHSVDHPHFRQIADTEIRRQLTSAAATIREVTGADPRPLFRFPYGESSPHAVAVVNALGYVPVGWTVGSPGWKGTADGLTAAAVTERVVTGAIPGAIVLMHVGSNPDDRSTLDADALPDVIERLRDLGYRFVTMHALTE